jgi:large subunit GTPase 1
VLLNKADLLPQEVREAWAGELEARGLSFAWWSAKAAGDAAAEQASAVVAALSAGLPPPDFPVPEPTAESDRTRIRGAEELLEWLEREARAAAKGATGRRSVAASFLGESDSDSDDGEEGREGRAGKEEVGESEGGGEGGGDDGLTEEQRHRRETANRRPTAGFVGFPNVGKSSTLNALFGRKKAAVAPTPGKTKHFQTLDLFVRGGRTLTLCDCPGLVFPRVASSKADMVAAGVVPIDRLTDVRAPVAVVCAEVGREGLERAYGVRLPPLRPGETRRSPPFAADVLRAVALSRGWVVQNALPDESRAGRMILRDHCSGKLPHFCWPPGKEPKKEGEAAAAAAAAAGEVEASASAEAAEAARDDSSAPLTPDARSPPASASAAEQREFLISEEARAEAQRELDALELNGEDDETDLEALEAEAAFVAGASAQQQQRAKRAAHKFQKRPARTKGDRGQGRQGLENGYDGAAMATGKKGGLVRGGVMTPAL